MERDNLALLAAFLPADLIDFIFELLPEPLSVWDELRPVDLIGSCSFFRWWT